MIFLSILLGALALFSDVVSAQTAEELDAIVRATTSYPSCALKCMKTIVPQSRCSFTDVHCLCTNQELTKETEGCILGNCTIYEGLQTKNITMTMCGAPVRDKHKTPLIISITGGTLATMAFVMRLCATLSRRIGRPLGADDYLAGAALLLAAPPTLTAIPFRDNGLGKDIWTLDLQSIEKVLMLYYLGSVFYIASITMVKMSLVCFILRVFPDQRLRRVCYMVMALVAGYGISFVTATALQCWPAEYAWLRVDSKREGKCNNVHLQAWMAAIFNIVLDLILLVLPLPSLWSLQMGIKKKLMIMIMFSLGLFVTIISAVRLHTLILFANSQNITWDYVEAGYWSLVEMHASIICACLPYCRHLLISLGANFLKSTRTGDSRGYTSRTNTSRRVSEGVMLSVSKAADSTQTSKRGDEGDFVPLVEYPNRTWDSHQLWDKQTTVSAVNKAGSTESI